MCLQTYKCTAKPSLTHACRWVTYHWFIPTPQINDFSGTEKSDCPSGTGPRRAGQQVLPFFTGCSNSDGNHRCLAVLMVLTIVPQYYVNGLLPAEGGSIPLVLVEASALGNLVWWGQAWHQESPVPHPQPVKGSDQRFGVEHVGPAPPLLLGTFLSCSLVCRQREKRISVDIHQTCLWSGAGHISRHLTEEGILYLCSASRHLPREIMGQLHSSSLEDKTKSTHPSGEAHMGTGRLSWYQQVSTRMHFPEHPSHVHLWAAFRWSWFSQHITPSDIAPVTQGSLMQYSKWWQLYRCCWNRSIQWWVTENPWSNCLHTTKPPHPLRVREHLQTRAVANARLLQRKGELQCNEPKPLLSFWWIMLNCDSPWENHRNRLIDKEKREEITWRGKLHQF